MAIIYGDATQDGLQILGCTGYTVPTYGSNRSEPYGDLTVNGYAGQKVCPVKEESCVVNGEHLFYQYIIYNRKRYRVRNGGGVYGPRFVFVVQNK